MERTGLDGTVAVVTGAGQGIGRAVAVALADGGAEVAAVDSRTEGLSELDTVAGRYRVDVRDSAEVDDLVADVERELGPIGVLVNVAGILRPGPVESLTDEDWLDTFAVNTHGVFFTARAVSRRMIPRRTGSIITVGSNAAGIPRMRMSAYAASKAAAVHFTKCLGLELARHGIRCNIVSPGSTDTAMQRALWPDADGAQGVIAGDLDAYRVGIPLGRLAEPVDIADAVLFLASDRARHITMHDLYVDGGATLR